MKKHILFVDDEQPVLDALRRMLHSYRGVWDITCVDCPEAAWKLLMENPVDVVVADIKMPGMSGLELLERIQQTKHLKDLPVIMLTGLSTRELKRQALSLGAADLLNKPVEPEDLVARLRSVLRLKSYQDELKAHNELLERRVEERTSDLFHARLDIIWRLAKAAEHRDDATGNHVIRVGCISRAIAETLGLDRDFVATLFLAAPLHDIGKNWKSFATGRELTSPRMFTRPFWTPCRKSDQSASDLPTLPTSCRKPRRQKMKRILFVDDEPKILTGLRRSLRSFRNEWEMVFAEGGAAALEQLASVPFDVVISDARMPGVEGSVLLRKVMEIYPDSARMILSGQCSRTSVLKCVAVTHQFLSKLCEPETLKSAVQGVCKMRDAFRDETTRKAISRTQWLPSQARLYRELAAVIDSSEASAGNLAGIIARDIGMTAKVVQLVSSGFFGSPQHVASAAEAVKLLGLETIRALFAPSAGFQLCSEEGQEEDLQLLTDHSFAVAAAARQIMQTLTDDRTMIADAYLAGVLHEVGTLALTDFAHECPRNLNSATSVQSANCWSNAPSNSAEAGPDPGGYLVALWGLPDNIVQAIAYHRIPAVCPERVVSPLIALHVANAILEQASGSVERRGGPEGRHRRGALCRRGFRYADAGHEWRGTPETSKRACRGYGSDDADRQRRPAYGPGSGA